MMNPIQYMITAFVLLFSISSIAAEKAPLAPFHAEYKVLRNGKDTGHATMNLNKKNEDIWEFTSETKGTDGLAKILGIDVRETSQFHWRDGMPEGLTYNYDQAAAIKSRQRQINFDWVNNKATMTEGKETKTYALQAGAMDRHCVTLALATQLQHGAKNFELHVTVKDRLETQQFNATTTTEHIEVPAGKLDAQRIERQGKEHPIRAWFALDHYPIPIQMEQAQGKGDTVTLQLISFKPQ